MHILYKQIQPPVNERIMELLITIEEEKEQEQGELQQFYHILYIQDQIKKINQEYQ